MIAKLLQVTNAVIGEALPVHTTHLLACIVGGQPVMHTGGGNFAPIANDMSGSWAYQRIRGEVSVTSTRLAGDPCDGLQATVPLRIVALLDRDGCGDVALELAAALRSSASDLEVATEAFSVSFERLAWQFDPLPMQEFTPAPQIPTHKTMLVVDATIVVRGRASCMADCEVGDVTCAIIEAATIAKIRECLGERINDLCEGGVCDLCTEIAKVSSTAQAIVDCIDEAGKTEAVQALICDPCPPPEPCDPTTVNGEESETPTITVLQGGNPVGTLDPVTGVVTVDECPPPEPCPVVITINDTEFATIADPCATPNLNVEVVNEDEEQVGVLIGEQWVVPTAKSLCGLITEADFEEISDCIRAAGKRPDVMCDLLRTTEAVDVFDEVIDCLPNNAKDALNVSVQLKDSGGNNIGAPDVYTAGTTNNKTAPDGSFQVRDSAGNAIGSPVAVRSGQTGVTATAPDATVQVNGTPATTVLSNGTLNVQLSDGVNTVTPVSVTPGPGVLDIVLPAGANLCTLLGAVPAANVKTDIIDCLGTPAYFAIGGVAFADLDAQAYISRVEQADGQLLEWQVRKAYFDFIAGLKADSLWASLGAACIMAGARTVAGALTPLRGPMPTNVGFVSGDYDRETGMVGNASNKYINTNWNNNVNGQNDDHNAVYITTQDTTGTGIAYMGAGVSNTGSNLIGRSGTSPFNVVARSRTSTAHTGTTSGTGLLGISRSASGSYTLRRAGGNETVTQASQTAHNNNLYVFARNNGGAPDIFSNGRLTWYSAGAALNLATLETRIAQLIADINAAL